MTDGQNWGQAPHYPPQGYGQRRPQDPPWQPAQYDPHAHQQRMVGQQSEPQAPPWNQPGYDGQPPTPPWQSHRRGRSRWPLYGALAALLVIVGGGVAYALAGHGSTPAPLAAAVAKTETCKQQYAAWKAGPGKPEAAAIETDARALIAAGKAEDIKSMDTALEKIGADASADEAHPMPACADPKGYWNQYLAAMVAAGDNASATPGLGGILTAEAPMKPLNSIEAKLHAELKRTTAH